MHFIYLHGFNSAYDPNSEKIQQLSHLGTVSGITYNTFATHKEIFQHISHEIYTQVHDREDIVFVGTSLGGFWAAEMARHFGVPSVIINPCYDPYEMLRKYVGETSENYQTGETNVLTNEVVETYPVNGIIGSDNTYEYLPLTLLDMGDNVIDSFKTREVLEGFPMVHWAEGSHRFEHIADALAHINEYMNYCNFVEQLDE
jgi:predicted esterase YcpF (UPF0227 family)